MNRAAFSEAAESITPPRWCGWFAITPTGAPFSRVIAVTMFLAQRGESSSIELESEMDRITARTSYTFRGSAGTAAPGSAPKGSWGIAGSGRCAELCGRWPSRSRTSSAAA